MDGAEYALCLCASLALGPVHTALLSALLRRGEREEAHDAVLEEAALLACVTFKPLTTRRALEDMRRAAVVSCVDAREPEGSRVWRIAVDDAARACYEALSRRTHSHASCACGITRAGDGACPMCGVCAVQEAPPVGSLEIKDEVLRHHVLEALSALAFGGVVHLRYERRADGVTEVDGDGEGASSSSEGEWEDAD